MVFTVCLLLTNDIFQCVEYVWRVVNLEITQRPQSELLALEDQVLTSARVTDIKDIDKALVAWDANLRDYLESGGTALSKHRQVGAIMRLIPIRVRDQALWEFDKFEGQPEVLRHWIRERTKWFTKADAGRPAAARAHLFDGEPASDEDRDALLAAIMAGLCPGRLIAMTSQACARL